MHGLTNLKIRYVVVKFKFAETVLAALHSYFTAAGRAVSTLESWHSAVRLV